MLRLVCSWFTSLIAISAFSPVLFAQAHGWPVDGPAFSASPTEIQAAASTIKPEPFTNATVLFEQERYSIDSSGKVTRVHQLLYRIETKAGVDAVEPNLHPMGSWYQNQPSIRARIMQVDGKVSELDPHTLTDVPAKNEQDDAFSNARIYKGPLPSLAIGAIVEEETTVVGQASVLLRRQRISRISIARCPVIRSRVILETPADTPFQSKVKLPRRCQDPNPAGRGHSSKHIRSIPRSAGSLFRHRSHHGQTPLSLHRVFDGSLLGSGRLGLSKDRRASNTTRSRQNPASHERFLESPCHYSGTRIKAPSRDSLYRHRIRRVWPPATNSERRSSNATTATVRTKRPSLLRCFAPQAFQPTLLSSMSVRGWM